MSAANDHELSGKGGVYHVLLASLLLLMALQPFAHVAGGFLVQLGVAGYCPATTTTRAARRSKPGHCGEIRTVSRARFRSTREPFSILIRTSTERTQTSSVAMDR